MGSREFFHGDVVSRVGILEKFLVWCADLNQYHMMIVDKEIGNKVYCRHCDARVERGLCHRNFVKVGTWDFEKGVEVEDDD